ncbi:MAG: prolyl oligopeptidase family serine peptidase [Bacteroidales bacterium]|jgi:dipeptidyl aminopeptidase/acylaminoacyl peptidase|nr:prolyl oligopeptidase family serine peptidase [Bacteroidales bacterium]MDD2571008.1 prolyl oligopeptidase family serine peptidase [Bacteroidales bacterium]MDD3384508.1 prolyl oligopeptidase family serine peptidase [Bacteroidales bacterium]MDD3811642.1 prolyl oligopeptidase family serine peptidase [Bacteroidales bacterium]MDD3871761.1 prolyl oligopeptidase family serine peptidase [Bacteroidales bacterium]
MKHLWITLLFMSLIPSALMAQNSLAYQVPPPELAAIVDAPATPTLSLSHDGTLAIVQTRAESPNIEDYADEMLRLAGLRIDPAINGPSRPGYLTEISLLNLNTLEKREFSGIPKGMKIYRVSWAPDDSGVAIIELTSRGLFLWYADMTTLTARKLVNQPLNGLLGGTYSWLPDGKSLIVKIIPEDRGGRPQISAVPTGPVIQESTGSKAAVRTSQDMLTSPADELLFDYYAKARLIRVNIDGSTQNLLPTDLYTGIDIAPGGEFLLINRVTKPYSYQVGYSSWPTIVGIYNLDGQLVREMFRIPLMEDVPTGYDATRPGPRSIRWRQDAPASLWWVEALDKGDPAVEVPFRDQLYSLEAPFKGEPIPQFKTRLRFGGISWVTEDLAVMGERSSKTRQTITSFVNPSKPEAKPVVVWDRSSEDRYTNPGSFVSTSTKGRSLILTADKGRTLFLTGSGSSPEGDRPFLDKFDIKTQKTTRIWQSEAPYYESVSRILDPDKLVILTTRQSATEPANYFIRDLKSRKQPLTRVTSFTDPLPFMQGVNKERITYFRNDGVQLTATLYTPAGWKKEDGPLPTLMWAYPVEYKSKDAAGQISGSPYTFTRLSPNSAIPFVTQGYAILDNTAFPIIGEGDAEPNDTFVEQLVANAQAAIDKAAEMGVTDPKRVAVGGHSYGAFMTANLLAHCDLFAAGIARSGAYNRTLTPFGFQSERRTYWEAPEVYYKMSPFSYADRITEPLLMIHGIADNNSGTFPIQSERLFAALKGHGAPARLVMLPLESHGYSARESQLHMLWEMNAWLDKYVKNK